jgi:uncharacterized protein (DUF1330 family)
MKTYYKVTLATFAGIGIGAAAMQGLHAQSKPPVYYVAEVDVMNQEGFAKEYLPKARAAIKAGGGRVVASSEKPIPIDGEAPKSRVVVQVWDSIESIQAYRNSAEFKEARQIGDKYAKFRSFVVEGLAQ